MTSPNATHPHDDMAADPTGDALLGDDIYTEPLNASQTAPPFDFAVMNELGPDFLVNNNGANAPPHEGLSESIHAPNTDPLPLDATDTASRGRKDDMALDQCQPQSPDFYRGRNSTPNIGNLFRAMENSFEPTSNQNLATNETLSHERATREAMKEAMDAQAAELSNLRAQFRLLQDASHHSTLPLPMTSPSQTHDGQQASKRARTVDPPSDHEVHSSTTRHPSTTLDNTPAAALAGNVFLDEDGCAIPQDEITTVEGVTERVWSAMTIDGKVAPRWDAITFPGHGRINGDLPDRTLRYGINERPPRGADKDAKFVSAIRDKIVADIRTQIQGTPYMPDFTQANGSIQAPIVSLETFNRRTVVDLLFATKAQAAAFKLGGIFSLIYLADSKQVEYEFRFLTSGNIHQRIFVTIKMIPELANGRAPDTILSGDYESAIAGFIEKLGSSVKFIGAWRATDDSPDGQTAERPEVRLVIETPKQGYKLSDIPIYINNKGIWLHNPSRPDHTLQWFQLVFRERQLTCPKCRFAAHVRAACPYNWCNVCHRLGHLDENCPLLRNQHQQDSRNDMGRGRRGGRGRGRRGYRGGPTRDGISISINQRLLHGR